MKNTLENEMLDAAISWCDSNGINVLEPEQLASLVNSLHIAVIDAAPIPQQPAPAYPVEWATFLHYPQCWDTAAHPTLHDAIHEALAWSGCSVCKQAQPERAPSDAQRYQWLRQRIEVKKVTPATGPARQGIDVKIGCAFLDSKLPYVVPASYPEELAQKLDDAIDAAIKQGGQQ